MSVVATSVFLLFALIVLGFILGKRNIIHKESIPDLSALVLQVTMPVTVFCSIIDQERSQLVSYGVQTFLFIILLHLCALLVGLSLIHAVRGQELDQGDGSYNAVSDADQTADISIAYDRISATASDRSGRDIEKCADPDGSIAGFFRAVHDYGTIWHQYGSGGAIGVYDNVV